MKMRSGYLLFVVLTALHAHAGQGVVDPTQPPAEVIAFLPNADTQVEKPWQLTALQHKGSGGFAVVNGDFVQFGSSYNGFKLVKITDQQVIFISQSGDKKVLNLGLSNYMPEVNPQQKIKKTKYVKSIKK